MPFLAQKAFLAAEGPSEGEPKAPVTTHIGFSSEVGLIGSVSGPGSAGGRRGQIGESFGLEVVVHDLHAGNPANGFEVVFTLRKTESGNLARDRGRRLVAPKENRDLPPKRGFLKESQVLGPDVVEYSGDEDLLHCPPPLAPVLTLTPKDPGTSRSVATKR